MRAEGCRLKYLNTYRKNRPFFYKFVPLGIKDGVLEVGIVDAENIEARGALSFIASKLGIPFKLYLISPSDFNVAIENYKGLTGEVNKALSELDRELSDTSGIEFYGNVEGGDAAKKGENNKIIEDAPVIKIVAVIIRHATEGSASDIHIENVGDRVKVRFRVDGVLHTNLFCPLAYTAPLWLALKFWPT